VFPVLENDHTFLAVTIALLRLAYFAFRDEALNLQEAARGEPERVAVLGVRVHFQDKFGG
jgi:hypothetical protein